MAVKVLTTFQLLDPSVTRSCPATWATTRWISPPLPRASTIYGGGGFLYDTSLDGADSIEIGDLSPASLLHGNGGNDSFYLTAEAYGSTVYGGQGADLIDVSWCSIRAFLLPGLLVTAAMTSCFSMVLEPLSIPPFLVPTSLAQSLVMTL